MRFDLLQKIIVGIMIVSTIPVLVGLGWPEDSPRIVFKQDGEVDDLLPRVYVAGAVKEPGVYLIKAGDYRVNDLITDVGGFVEGVDMAFVSKDLNLSSMLQDEQHIFIPYQDGQGGEMSDRINLNSASSAELETLPGIGPSTAAKIIASRPYLKVEDVMQVSGIGESTYNKIRGLISL